MPGITASNGQSNSDTPPTITSTAPHRSPDVSLRRCLVGWQISYPEWVLVDSSAAIIVEGTLRVVRYALPTNTGIGGSLERESGGGFILQEVVVFASADPGEIHAQWSDLGLGNDPSPRVSRFPVRSLELTLTPKRAASARFRITLPDLDLRASNASEEEPERGPQLNSVSWVAVVVDELRLTAPRANSCRWSRSLALQSDIDPGCRAAVKA